MLLALTAPSFHFNAAPLISMLKPLLVLVPVFMGYLLFKQWQIGKESPTAFVLCMEEKNGVRTSETVKIDPNLSRQMVTDKYGGSYGIELEHAQLVRWPSSGVMEWQKVLVRSQCFVRGVSDRPVAWREQFRKVPSTTPKTLTAAMNENVAIAESKSADRDAKGEDEGLKQWLLIGGGVLAIAIIGLGIFTYQNNKRTEASMNALNLSIQQVESTLTGQPIPAKGK